MKFVFPDISEVFDTGLSLVNTMIIENQSLLLDLLGDITNQIDGKEGKGVLSNKDKILPFDKSVELLDRFVPFSLNRKSLITRATTFFEKEAVTEGQYIKTSELMSQIESFLLEISQSFQCNLSFRTINVGTLLKASGMEFTEDYDSLGEKIIDYMELVTEFERKKLFFTLNLRSYMNDLETEKMLDTVLSHGYHLIMIESSEHSRLRNEKRLIVDASLCEIK